MSFSKKGIFALKISKKPLFGLVSFLILLVSLPLTVFLVKKQQIYSGKASFTSLKAQPQKVKITNLHGGGFSVSWVSVDPLTNSFLEAPGSIIYGTDQNNLNQEAFDDRGKDILSETHHISIFNLNPNTVYYFKIKSGSDLYGKSGETWVKNGPAAQQRTPGLLTLNEEPFPLFGYIKDNAGQKISGALVYVRLKKNNQERYSDWMSTITTGGWIVDAGNARINEEGILFNFNQSDQVLIEVAGRLRKTVRAQDLVARIGGDEFVVVLVDLSENARLQTLAERILSALSEPIHKGPLAGQPISASLGVIGCPGVVADAERLLKAADRALYASKEAGRGRVTFSSETNTP